MLPRMTRSLCVTGILVLTGLGSSAPSFGNCLMGGAVFHGFAGDFVGCGDATAYMFAWQHQYGLQRLTGGSQTTLANQGADTGSLSTAADGLFVTPGFVTLAPGSYNVTTDWSFPGIDGCWNLNLEPDIHFGEDPGDREGDRLCLPRGCPEVGRQSPPERLRDILRVGPHASGFGESGSHLHRPGTIAPDRVINLVVSKRRGRVDVSWMTTTEANTMGFHLIDERRNGRTVQLNDTLIPAMHPGQLLGGTYCESRIAMVSVKIYVDLVKFDGTTERFGPVVLESATA